MRPALVTVGAVLVGVALVSAGALLLIPPSPEDQVVSTDVPSVDSGPNQSRQAWLGGTNTTDGAFDLSWQSTGAMAVRLFGGSACSVSSAACSASTPLAIWPRNASGTWSESGTITYPFLMVWVDAGSSSVSFQAEAISHAVTHPALPMLTLLVSGAAAAALAAIGALAIFLGLFLRGGVYGGRPPLVSKSAEDAELIAGGAGAVTGPRTGRSGGESGPPPPRAPSRGR